MSDIVYFECTTLPANKQGVIAEENGAYIQAVGALNVLNSAGAHYKASGVEQLFHESSDLIRRVRNGDCKAEEGHPKPFGLTEDEYIARINMIEETRVCALHRRLWLDYKACNDGSVLIMSEIVPTGYFGPALKQSYANPGENVNFSIRSFTEDRFHNGRVEKTILDVVTFDRVTEPGINKARAFQSPALESLVSVPVTPRNVINSGKVLTGMGLESSGLIIPPQALFNALGWEFKNTTAAKPSYLKWLDQ